MAVLSSLVIRSLGRAMLPMMVRRGFSARGYRRYLVREFGKSYRDTILFADFREFKGMFKHQGQIKALLPGTKPPRSYMTEVDYKRERLYKGIGQATYEHRDTGELKTKYVSMYDNHFDSKEAFTDTWMRDKGWEESDPEWQAIGVEWEVIYHKVGAPY